MRAVRDALGSGVGTLGSPQVVSPFAHSSGEIALPPPAREHRRGVRVAAWVGVLIVGAALGVAGALLADDDEAREEVPLAAVPPAAQALGSDLAIPERSLDCRGRAPTQSSPSCSIVQTELPGGTVLVPEDGVIVGWTVRGAHGDLAVDVIRPRGSDTVRVARSQFEFVGNAGPQHFETRLPVEAGDQIGLELGPGASAGVSEAEGATTQRWLEPFGGAYGTPDRGEGTGFDYEVALRADFVPGEQVGVPKHLTGAAAANAADGRVRDFAPLEVDQPQPTRLRVELVEVDGEVALDVLRAGRRTLRVVIPDLVPKGIPVELKTFEYPGEPFGEADVWWVNPNTGRTIFHYFILGEEELQSVG